MKYLYTAIFGHYDELNDYEAQPGWKQICFTDQDFTAKNWQVIKLENDFRLHRQIKCMPHKFLPEHEYSAWIDGDLVPFLKLDDYLSEFLLMEHPDRTNIYDEAVFCDAIDKDSMRNMEAQLKRYKEEGYTTGLCATGFIIRKDTPLNRKVGREWWTEIKNGSHRDQVSFNYVAWKNNLKYDTIPFMMGLEKRGHYGV